MLKVNFKQKGGSMIDGKNKAISKKEVLMNEVNEIGKTRPFMVKLRQWPELFHEPKIGTLKGLLLNRKSNGFDKCVRFVSNRAYLIVDETFKYFDSLRERGSNDE
jgi:hypothetical protein